MYVCNVCTVCMYMHSFFCFYVCMYVRIIFFLLCILLRKWFSVYMHVYIYVRMLDYFILVCMCIAVMICMYVVFFNSLFACLVMASKVWDDLSMWNVVRNERSSLHIQ